MNRKPVFEGLVYDEEGNPVEVHYVGSEPCYVVQDPWGMAYHIPTEQVDRQVLNYLQTLVEGHEDQVLETAARFLGQEDPAALAMLRDQLQHLDRYMETLLQMGLPEDARYMLGMMGFHVVINHHGEVVDIHLPEATEEPPDPEF